MLVGAEPVSCTADRIDPPRMQAQLVAQPLDVNIDEIRARIEGNAPNLGQKLGARYDLVRVVSKVDQQPELSRGQVERFSRQARPVAETMDLELAELELPDGHGAP